MASLSIRLLLLFLLLAAPLAAQPTWQHFTTLGTARLSHNALYLGNDSVLVIGGLVNSTPAPVATTSCEIIRPSTGAVLQTGSLAQPHAESVALFTRDSNVVVVSGLAGEFNLGALAGAVELYDRSTGRWRVLGALRTPRRQHAAIFLNDRDILVVGGRLQNHTPLADAEIFDITTGTSRPAAPFLFPVSDVTMAYNASGQPVIIGGRQGTPNSRRTDSLYRYDLPNNQWALVGRLVDPIQGPQVLKLRDGRLFVSGGSRAESPVDFAREVQLEQPGAWRLLGRMADERAWHGAGQWSSDSVLITGGFNNKLAMLTTGAWVNIRTGAVTPGPGLRVPRSFFRLVAVPWCPDAQGNATSTALLAIGGTRNITGTQSMFDSATASVEILAVCSPLAPGIVEYTYHATAGCPGTQGRLYVPFNSRRFTDTITSIAFVGPYARFFEYAGAQPVTIPITPTSDQRIPVDVRWPQPTATKVSVEMVLTTSARDTFRIGIEGSVPLLTTQTLDLLTLHMGAHPGTYDTCVTVTNTTERTIRFSDSSWLRGSGGEVALTSPTFPIVLQPHGKATLCFRSLNGTSGMSDTLLLGGLEVWECPHCALATIRVDGEPQSTAAVQRAEEEQGIAALSIHPNPANVGAELLLELAHPQTLQVRVIAANGREQFALPEERYGRGRHILSIDAGGWQPGNYWVEVRGDGLLTTRQLVIVR